MESPFWSLKKTHNMFKQTFDISEFSTINILIASLIPAVLP